MYKTITSASALAALAATVTAHGTVTGVTIDGVYTGGFSLDYYYAKQNNAPIPEHIGWYAENLDNGFVEPNSFETADIICHKAASPEGSSDSLAKVAAGGTVEFHWSTWPESHMGPVISYVAPYTGDIASVKKESLKWTKIDAAGYEDGKWAASTLISTNNTWPVTVPASLAPGKYVFRHEIIALHGGGELNGAQAYPQCLNIEITGSGTVTPEGVVGTELYTPTDPGIHFSPYSPTIDYPIPGPPLFAGASSGSPTKPSTPSAAPIPSGNSTVPVVPSAPASPVATPAAEPQSSSAPEAGGEASGALPKEFTLETFISWLEGMAGGEGAASQVRRHARALF